MTTTTGSTEHTTWADIQADYDTRLDAYVAEHGSPPPTFTQMISDEQIAALRQGFDYTRACGDILWALSSTQRTYRPNVEWILRSFYTTPAQHAPGGLSPSQRELVQVAIAVQYGSKLNIGIHVYWALCQDDALDVGQIANSAMLASAYLGVDAWSNAQSSIATTLQALAAAADAGTTAYDDVFAALVAAFS